MPIFGSRSGRVAPANWQASKSDQALEFLNIACADAVAPPPSAAPAPPQTPLQVAPAPPRERPQMLAFQEASARISSGGAALQSLRKRSFAFNVVGISILCPLGFSLLLVPLTIRGLHAEIFDSYYWGLQVTVFLAFAESWGRMCLADRMPLRWLVQVWLAGMAIEIGCSFIRGVPCSLLIGIRTAGMLFSLQGPSSYRLIAGLWNQLPMKPLVFLQIGMNFGATPVCLSVGMYFYLAVSGATSRSGPLVIALLVWVISPWLLKPGGVWVTGHGCPAAKFTGPRLFLVYRDVVYGTLGMLVFGERPWASAAYALTIVPVLAVNVLRGRHAMLRLVCSKDAHISRLEILLESLGAVLGRMLAYVMFLLMHLAAAAGAPAGFIEGMPLLSSKSPTGRMSAIIYGGGGDADMQCLAAVFGIVVLWASFAAFCMALPRCWTAAPQTACKVAPMPIGIEQPTERRKDPRQQDDEFNQPFSPRGYEPTTLKKAAWATDGDIVDLGASEGGDSSGDEGHGWVMGGTRSETRRQQYYVLNRFLNQHSDVVFSTCLFTFTCAISVANLCRAVVSELDVSWCD